MTRVKYTLTCWKLKWTLSDKRWHRGFKFQPLQPKRDWYIRNKKRIEKLNKHTMGTDVPV